MTHIGYIKHIYPDYGFGIIIDAKKNAHCFELEPNKEYKPYTFVSYEGENSLVTDIIPLEDYPRFSYYRPNQTFYLQDGVGSWYKFFLVNKKGERYSLDGPEAFIIGKLFKNKPLFPPSIEPISFEEYQHSVEEIFNKVEYVSNHLEEIADSYKVYIKVSHFSKVGGDDRFYTNRCVSLLYRDTYLSKFFLPSEELDKQVAYSSNYDYPFGEGRQMEEEQNGKQSFLNGYNKTEHYSTLLFELNQSIENKDQYLKQEILDWAIFWGFDFSRKDFSWIVNSQATNIEIASLQIDIHNKKTMNLMK